MTIPICLLLLISEQSNFSEQRASGLLTHVVDQLINNDLNNVILTIRYRETSTYDDKSDPDDTGTIIYGRVGDTYFVDSDFSSSPRVSSENRRRVPFIYQRQIFHESNKPNLKLQYSVHGGQKNVKHISADPTEDDNTKILAVADRARLVPTLTSWFPLGIKIIDIENKYQPVEILEDNSKTMYSYKTPYGSLTVLIDHHNSQPSLVNISLVKGSNDLVSPRTKDPVRINQIKTNVFGTVGYDRIEYNLKFGYGIVDGVRTLTSIEDSNTTRSGNRKHTVTCTWEIVSRRACNDPVELHNLLVHIPEGEAVGTSNAEFSKIDMAYRDGEVVREVDGTSIEEVINQKERPRLSIYWVVASGLLVAAIAVAIYFIRRRS